MYEYLKQWPKDRENGWSDELQGVCHDNENWFFTQNGNLWKFPLNHDLNTICKKENRAKGIFKNPYGYRLGDCDHYAGYIFVPVTGDNVPYIAVFDANNLSFITKQNLKHFGSDFTSIHWCAINPNDGRLYTSDRHLGNDMRSDTTPILVYDINIDKIKQRKSDFLTYTTFILIYNGSSKRMSRDYVQGGCFDKNNHLHLTNGDYTMKFGDHNYANDKGGISVFSIPEIPKNNTEKFYQAKRIAYSNQTKCFRYQFNGTGEEPSGITYWELDGINVPGEICGCLHAIMSDNCGTGADDFYFKHYKRLPCRDSYVKRNSKMGLIITNDSDTLPSLIISEHKRRVKNQQLMSGLFQNRNIDHMIIENQYMSDLENLMKHYFSKSLTDDWNYVYINCHGDNDGLKLGHDEEKSISYDIIDCILREIRGKKIIFIDACHSGIAVNLSTVNTFILTSTNIRQEAKGDTNLGNYATMNWVRGAGYDSDSGQGSDMEADDNNDNKVSLIELRDYTNDRLETMRPSQTCEIFSENDGEIIFE